MRLKEVMRSELRKILSKQFVKKYRGPKVHDTLKYGIIFIVPSLIILSFVMLYPLIRSIVLSFYNFVLTRPDQTDFIFLDNFITLLKDEVFWISFKNTLIFTSITVSIGLAIGLVVAIVFDQLPKVFEKFRGLILIPWVIPGVVIGFLFRYMFDQEIGIINYILNYLNIINEYLPWLSRGELAMTMIILAHLWNQIPFYTLMIAATLKSIPQDIQEAAFVEGASRWQEFLYITLPFSKTTILITTLLMVILNFNTFPIIWTTTGGGPVYSTTTTVIYIFSLAFEQYEMSYSATVGVLWAIILLIISIFYIRILQRDF
jgi:multiple sugar transport system permease protein